MCQGDTTHSPTLLHDCGLGQHTFARFLHSKARISFLQLAIGELKTAHVSFPAVLSAVAAIGWLHTLQCKQSAACGLCLFHAFPLLPAAVPYLLVLTSQKQSVLALHVRVTHECVEDKCWPGLSSTTPCLRL